jgi:chromosome segregation ATPase
VSESINTDSTEKLQELLETIASGINKTEEILARSQQVEAEVSQHRDAILKDTKLVSQLTLHTERKAYEVVEVQAGIEQIANVVGSTVGELGGLDALESLQKEHKSILSTLEEIKTESQQFQKLQTETVHIDQKLTLIQEQFQTLSNLVSGAQADLVGQAMAGGDLNQIIARATQELRQEQQVIDNEHRQKIRSLERKQQSLISLILGGVGVAVVLLIVILVIVITKK